MNGNNEVNYRGRPEFGKSVGVAAVEDDAIVPGVVWSDYPCRRWDSEKTWTKDARVSTVAERLQ